MLTELTIQNFKAWRETGPIRLAPLTVFFGPNSAGKTSLLQFLLLLQQSAASLDPTQVLYPGDDSTPVDLGSFHGLVYRHEGNRDLTFSLTWNLPQPLNLSSFSGDVLRFDATIQPLVAGAYQQVRTFRYTLGDPLHHGITVSLHRASNGQYRVTSEPEILLPHQGQPQPLPDPIRFYGFPAELLAHYQNATIPNHFAQSLEEQLRRIHYLGPLRQKPQRTYHWSGDTPASVGFDGRHTIAALLASKGRKFSLGPKSRSASLLQVADRWLHQLGLLESFVAAPLSSRSFQHVIGVTAAGSSVSTFLPDVGFGVSQVLPVIVESFFAAPHSTVVLEQPELHLHPRVQARLADLFVEAIHSREGGQPRHLQFIVESHSEHFVYRLQRLIAEDKVQPAEVALYFCQPGPQGSHIERLRIDSYGNIENWPDHFFGNEMEDVTARLAAAARKAKVKPPR